MDDRDKTRQELISELNGLRPELSRLREQEAGRQKDRQDLAQTQDRLQTLIYDSNDAIFSLDAGRNLTDCNPAFLKMFGYSRDEVIGRSIRFAHPNDESYERFGRTIYPLLEATGSWRGEWQYQRKNGSLILLGTAVSAQKLPDGQVLGYIAVVRDITARKQAERTLGYFKTVVEHSSDAIGLSSPQGKHWYQNQTFDELFGDIGDDPPASVFVDPKTWREVFDTTMAGEPWAGEVKMRRQGGGIVDILLHAYPFKDERGEVLGLVGVHTDITKRKQNENTLKESELRLKIAGKASYDLVYEWDVAGDNLEWFGDLDGLLGFASGEISQNITAWLGLIHPEDQHLLKNAVEHHRTSTEPIHYEYRIQGQNEAYRYWSDYGLPLLDDQGLPYKWIGVCTDITKRKKAEEEIKQLSQFRESIIDNANIWLSVLNERGEVVLWNKAAESISGYLKDEVIGHSKIWEWSYPDDEYRKEISAKTAAIIDKIEVLKDFETTIRRKDGKKRIMSWNSRSLFSDEGNTIGSISIGRDITERKLATDALRESQDRFRALSEESPLGVSLIDRQGGYKYLNPSFIRMFGYTLEDLKTGRDWFKLAYQDEDYRELALKAWRHDLSQFGTGEARTQTFEVTCKDGSSKTICFRSVTIASHGQFVLYEDISERIQAETERAGLESQLRQSQKMQAIGTLAGGVAHDFNNILTAIMGYGELAQMGAEKGRNNQAQLEHIVAAAQRARDLVKQLLTFSRRSETDFKTLDLNRLLASSVKMLKHTIPKMIDIQMDLAENLDFMQANATQMEQVIMNLASNASDAMPDGGALMLETASVWLGSDFAGKHLEMAPGRYVLLTVSDTGVGMDKDTLAQIFDPFFTTKEIGKGTGLGLSTVYGIVRDHGGHISCYSEPGLGATFKVYFPVIESDSPPAQDREPSLQDAPGGQEAILLVDDEDYIRELGSEMLGEAGYRVTTAINGEEALETYQSTQKETDLIILDLGMPGMGGHKCLQKLLALNPRIKVLVASGYSASSKVKELLNQGAAGFIAKPFTRNDLLITIRTVLDN